MINVIASILMLVSASFLVQPEPPSGPAPPEEGPGAPVYAHDSVRVSDFAEGMDGYWLFEPLSPQPGSAPVVVFHHGYGAINPMIYGAWIRHLVQQGYLVIYPRYQKNLLVPNTKTFVQHASAGIKSALGRLQEEAGRVAPDTSAFFLAGHSYGGVVAANMAARYRELRLPRPRAAFLCTPGSGPFRGGLLEEYSDMDSTLRLGVVIAIHDHVVGEELGRKIYNTAVNTPRRFLIRQHPDDHGEPAIGAGHNECYALDDSFDAGLHNLSFMRAQQVAQENAVDYYLYWKMLDALIKCSLEGRYCPLAEGCGAAASYMGNWSDGYPVQPLEIHRPSS